MIILFLYLVEKEQSEFLVELIQGYGFADFALDC